MEPCQSRTLADVLDEVVELAKKSALVADRQEDRELATALNSTATAARGNLSARDDADLSKYLEKAKVARELVRRNVATGGRNVDALLQAFQLVSQILGSGVANPTAGAFLASDDEQLLEAANYFGLDARRAARTMLGLYLVVLTLVVVSIVMLWLLVFEEKPRPAAVDFVVQSLPAFALMAIATLLVQHANRQRRNTEELKRVALQMRALPIYLRPLPPDIRNLFRSVMIQRLFPRLLEDDDPLRESDWFPAPDSLMVAINSEYQELLDDLRDK